MIKPRSQGRMIRIDIAEDEGLSKLSDGAARLYFHLTPFLSAYGKFSGGPHTIRENIVPLLRWSAKRINGYLVEINNHTSMRVWKQFGRFYVHDVAFFENQVLRGDRMGEDRLPSYPGPNVIKPITSKNQLPEVLPEQLPDLLQREVEVEVKDKKEKDVEVQVYLADSRTAPLVGASAPGLTEKGNGNSTPSGDGNGPGLPDYVVADMDRLSPEAKKTMWIMVNDYKAGTIPREEAAATVAPFKMSRRSIDVLFPIREG